MIAKADEINSTSTEDTFNTMTQMIASGIEAFHEGGKNEIHIAI